MTKADQANLPHLTDDALRPHERVSHGFFTRQGGVSTGLYSSLNVGLGSQDDTAKVMDNRGRITRALGLSGAPLNTLYQVHSADVIVVDEPLPNQSRPKADAMVTTTPGLALGALSADCGPVLFASEDGRVVASAHAGWRGALSGVLTNTVETMVAQGARREGIRAVLGPTISQANYEVRDDFRDAMLEAHPGAGEHFKSGKVDGAWQFDLPGFIIEQLETTGIGHAAWIGACTYADEEQFYSYRRATHRKEPDYGRLVAAIAILPEGQS